MRKTIFGVIILGIFVGIFCLFYIKDERVTIDYRIFPKIVAQEPEFQKMTDPFAGLELSDDKKSVLEELVKSALERTEQNISYDPTYFSIDYPNGDVPADRGVCTDVVIRSLRKIGVDLQQEVHEDMNAHFDLYPKKWGLASTDTNIDHRRVPNLITFFKRFAEILPITDDYQDYYPGDIITWVFPNNKTHTGIVVDYYSTETNIPLIVHNVGRGPEMEDVLFKWEITGHFRYLGK